MPVPAPLAVTSPDILISPSPTISCPVILKSTSILIFASLSVKTDAVALSVMPVKLPPPPLPPCNTPPGVVPSPTYIFLVSVTYIISPSAGVILVLFASVPRLSFKAILKSPRCTVLYIYHIYTETIFKRQRLLQLCIKNTVAIAFCLLVYFKKACCSFLNVFL